MDGQEWTDAIRYHIAYGQAADWAKAQWFDHGWGRASARGGTPAAELESEIARRLGAVDETTLETIREAIADALAGRLPQCVDRARPARRRARGTLAGPEDLVEPARDIGRAIVSRATRGP